MTTRPTASQVQQYRAHCRNEVCPCIECAEVRSFLEAPDPMAGALNQIAQLAADPGVAEDPETFYQQQLMGAIAIATLALPPIASETEGGGS